MAVPFAMLILHVATYNVHSCRGLDLRVSPARIARVIAATHSDVVALEEVRVGQAREIASRLGFYLAFGLADVLDGHDFGNAILSRYPIAKSHNYRIGVPNREQRSCVRADIEWPRHGRMLHVFAAHLGLSGEERREQVARLVSTEILANPELTGPRLLMGDFNEWWGGAVNRRLTATLARRGGWTWPGILPLVPFDRMYFDRSLSLDRVHLHRTWRSVFASDHVPLVATLSPSPGDTDQKNQ